MKHSDNYFKLFQLEETFSVDLSRLTENYRALQKVLHPDNFAHATDKERRLSVQQSAIVNDAYHVLKTPVERARYLLQLRGVELDDENNNVMDPMFLMQQMEIREALEAAPAATDPWQALDDLSDELSQSSSQLQQQLQASFDAGDLERAAQLIHKLQFFIKLQQELDAVEAALDQ